MPEVATLISAGDIFLTRGTSLISKLIRVFQRSKDEEPTQVNHTGIIVTSGKLEDVDCVESLGKGTVRHKLINEYGNTKDKIAIFRMENLANPRKRFVVEKAISYVGRKYGYIKIMAHFGDWCLGGKYVFRKLARMDKYPICSWVVAHSFKTADINFGIDPDICQPDDIWDYVTNVANGWKTVLELNNI